VQRLKVDQSFVQNLEHSANDEVIVRAIINLGHSLGLKVIAEGVETEGQLERLRQLGCDEVQGYLVSPPISAEALEELDRRRLVPAGLTGWRRGRPGGRRRSHAARRRAGQGRRCRSWRGCAGACATARTASTSRR
jgi:predicted signal transduction protein with EAL and GGDEF domain